jgi:hypothetical protein
VILAAALYVMMDRISGVRLRVSHILMPLLLSLSYPLVKAALPETGYFWELLIVVVAGSALYLFLLVFSGLITREDIDSSMEALKDRRETPHVKLALSILSLFEKIVDRFGR